MVNFMSKKMLSCRVDPDIIDMRDKLIKHFSDGVAKANSETVVSLAIRELYKNYLGDYKKGITNYSSIRRNK